MSRCKMALTYIANIWLLLSVNKKKKTQGTLYHLCNYGFIIQFKLIVL